GVVLEGPAQPAQQLADLALLVGLPAPEGQRRLQGLAHLLELLLQRAPGLARGYAHVALLQPLAGGGQDAARLVAERALPLAVGPGGELQLAPGGRAPREV